jgi:hypothetical protein
MSQFKFAYGYESSRSRIERYQGEHWALEIYI